MKDALRMERKRDACQAFVRTKKVSITFELKVTETFFALSRSLQASRLRSIQLSAENFIAADTRSESACRLTRQIRCP